MQITDYPSPSFGPRRGGVLPSIVVLHYTAMVSAQAALDRLCDPEIEVSAHYLIGRDGHVFQMVDEAQRAWHAGAGAWGSVTDVNSHSIGIELDNTGAQPFAEPQMAALEALLPGILSRWAIPAARVIAHSDMAPTRKCDPGRKFDWRRLALGGMSIWPEREVHGISANEQDFLAAATRFGYPEGDLKTRLSAFRQRFRPWAEGGEGAEGALLAEDVAVLTDLATRYPVDQVLRTA